MEPSRPRPRDAPERVARERVALHARSPPPKMGHAVAADGVRRWRPPRRRCCAHDFGQLHARYVPWESILYQETTLVKRPFLVQSAGKGAPPLAKIHD